MAIMRKNKEIIIFPDTHYLFQYAATDFAHRARKAVDEKGMFSVVLAGGNTPKLLFDTLCGVQHIPWQNIHFFFGDERYVPADDPNSNYHMAYEHLFSKVPVNPDTIYRIPTEYADPKDAAKNYEHTLRKIGDIDDNATPIFDLVYLGLGDNAHTASLMPFSDVVKHYADNPEQLVASLLMPESNTYRITLTPYAINNGLDIIFLVTGTDKAKAVWQVLDGPVDPLHYPAQLIQGVHNKTIWYMDQYAAKNLTRE